MITYCVSKELVSKGKDEEDLGLFNYTREEYGEDFGKHAIEQYKLFVELMDRVTQRRLNTNTFFLTANTALIAALSGLLTSHIINNQNFLLIDALTAFAGILLCVEWRGVINSYTQLNKGKFIIIHQMETKLPLSMFKAEWNALGNENNKEKYKPITKTEKFIPAVFIFLYLALPVSSYLIIHGLIL